MDKTKHRLLQYLGVSFALLLGFSWFRDSSWQGSTQLHTFMEVVATFLALMVGILALVRFYTRKNNTFLFLGSGFLGSGFLDLYHTVVTSTFFQDLFPSPPPSLIPWSWVASRLFLALLMYFSYLAWMREDRLGEAGAISKRLVYLAITVLTLISFVFSLSFRCPGPTIQRYLFTGRRNSFLHFFSCWRSSGIFAKANGA